MSTLHQLIAGAGYGDAITNYAFEIQKIIKESGKESHIFAPSLHIAKEYKGDAVRPLEELVTHINKEDVLLYHYSIGSKATVFYQQTEAVKMICYHNVTPKKYFTRLSKEQEEFLDKGRSNLSELIPFTKAATAVSAYNVDELQSAGFSNPTVIPLVFPDKYNHLTPDQSVFTRFREKKVNFLFVGRVVPNKRFEDLIKLFDFYQKNINPESRLFLVGSYIGNEKYYTFLKSMVFDLGQMENIFFSGHVTTEQLLSYYKLATLFVCLSEHEGFGLPLIEGMHFGIPVFALDRAAVSETMGGAGILLKDNNVRNNAELINYVLNKAELLNNIIAKQNKRLKFFTTETLKSALGDVLKTIAPEILSN